MKRISALLLALGFSILGFTQDSTTANLPASDTAIVENLPVADNTKEARKAARKNKWSNLDLANRSKDHLLLQFGMIGLSGAPDTIRTRGLSRGFNAYFMFDFPFKSNPQYSVAIGAGVSSSNIFFDKTYIDISGKNNNRLSFNDVSDTTHFKKYKLMNTYLEAPVELRFTADPSRPNKSWKGAVGFKVGTMIGAVTKGKTWQSSSGQTLNAYTQKEKAKRFFNGTRLSLTGRVGLGVLSLFGSYQINPFVKEGLGPDIRPFAAGITISGL